MHEGMNEEFLPPRLTKFLNVLGRTFCSNPLIAHTICHEIYDLIGGWKRDPGHPILAFSVIQVPTLLNYTLKDKTKNYIYFNRKTFH